MSFLLLKMKVFFPIVHQLLKRKETVDGRKENSFLKKKAFPVINCWPADKEKRKSGQRWQESNQDDMSSHFCSSFSLFNFNWWKRRWTKSVLRSCLDWFLHRRSSSIRNTSINRDYKRELSFHLLMEFSFPRLMTACVSRRGSACEECISCLKRRFQSNHWQVYFLFYYANDW